MEHVDWKHVNYTDIEYWKMIPGYEGQYMVSSWGRVKSFNYFNTKKEHLLTPHKNQNGYLSAQLCKKGKTKLILIHRLVALAFIPNPDNLPVINHKDENKTNNRMDNLEWCTYSHNSKHGNRKEKVIKTMIANGTAKPVAQLFNGKIIAKYSSISEAARATGCHSGDISYVCRGFFKTHKGFGWRYI